MSKRRRRPWHRAVDTINDKKREEQIDSKHNRRAAVRVALEPKQISEGHLI